MEFSLLYIHTAILGLISLFLILHFVFWRLKSAKGGSAKNSLPPEAGGAWPIIGHLHLLSGSKLLHITLGSLADKCGPAFIIRLGVRQALVVSDWELAKELFTANDVAISSRPKLLAFESMSYDFAMFGFSPYGAYWRELRKLISVELLSTRRLELLKHIRVSETEISVKELYNLWKDKKNGSGHVLVEMKQWFGDLNLNVILRMVAGKRYFGTIDAKDQEEARRCQKAMSGFFHFTGLFLVADGFPFLRWMDLGGYEKKIKASAKEMDLIAEEWLQEHRRKRESGDVASEQDFMDLMLSLLEDVDLPGYDPDTITKATCINLILGGADTNTVMLTWTLSLLMNHPHILRKAQEELDIQVGKERRVNESDIANLEYLHAIVKETLRLYPASRLGGPREFSEDCTLGGYHVTKGTSLILNLWKLQRDPRIWSNPSEFRPERFLTTHKDLDVKGRYFELIPFGAGRRSCPGTAFGLQMLPFVLANLLHAFDISTDEKTDMTESPGLTTSKATPLDVLISPRLSPNLY
uniref:Strychnine-10-hydroxylase n=1 Tax=Strychnos nux-vomica TaxID=28545 RepID=10H_STRNX|nr:strychnine-10-hydroxylase [Strychnos nux-vomica]